MRRGRPGIDGGGGRCDALARGARPACHFQRQGGPEQQAIAVCAAILAVQCRAQRARIVLGIAAGQILVPAARQTKVLRIANAARST